MPFVKFGTAIGKQQTDVEEKIMLELNQDTLKVKFPDVHPDAELTITFHRTLRIPDDDREYPLPPSLGRFPIRHVDDYRERVPVKWVEHGGVMLPMYQAEALWISFSSKHIYKHRAQYPFAIKIGTGKISAITGDDWEKGLKEEDYIVVPPQPWIDGYKIEEDVIRQFVAAPLGWGFSAEEQITGKAEHGGIQIEVFPMHRELFDKKYPERKEDPEIKTSGRGKKRFLGSGASGTRCFGSPGVYAASLDFCDCNDAAPVAAAAAEMGLAAGGRMHQEIFKDPHGKDSWKIPSRSRCFIHLANSMAWEAITEQKPPSTPVTAELYTRHGYPWFDYYDESQTALKATEKLAGLKSVMELGFQKGLNILPENTPTDIERVHVIKGTAGQVRVGNW